MSPAITRVPAVIDHLLDLFRAASPHLQVADGPTIGVVMSEAICVGFSENPDSPGYETSVEKMDGIGRPRYVEAFTVRCFLTLSAGDTDEGSVKRLRDRAGELLALLDTALRADHTKTGIWDRAQLGSEFGWVPIIDEHGTVCNVFFSVIGASLL